MASASTRPELLPIGDVARRTGFATSALRFYEEAGLLRPAGRRSGKRLYRADAVERLQLIRFCQRAGFTLAEIRQLLTPPRGRASKQHWRQLVDGKLKELETTIQRATEMRRILEASRDCDCVDLDHCDFVREETPLPAS